MAQAQESKAGSAPLFEAVGNDETGRQVIRLKKAEVRPWSMTDGDSPAGGLSYLFAGGKLNLPIDHQFADRVQREAGRNTPVRFDEIGVAVEPGMIRGAGRERTGAFRPVAVLFVKHGGRVVFGEEVHG